MTNEEILRAINTKTCAVSYWTAKKAAGRKYVKDVPIDEKIKKLREDRDELRKLLNSR